MPKPIVAFVRAVDALNYRVGRFAMYLIFVMAAILLARPPRASSSECQSTGRSRCRSSCSRPTTCSAAPMPTAGGMCAWICSTTRLRRVARDHRRDHILVRDLLSRRPVLPAACRAPIRHRLQAEELLGMGAATVADQGGDDGRHLPDAAAGDLVLLQGHRRSRAGSRSHEFRIDHTPDVRVDAGAAHDRAARLRRHRLRRRGGGAVAVGQGPLRDAVQRQPSRCSTGIR